MKHYKSVEILTNFQYQASLHKRKAPLVNFLATVLGGLIITAQTNAYLFCPPSSSTYNSHINKDESCLAYFMRIFNSCVSCSVGIKLSTLGVRHPRRIPSLRPATRGGAIGQLPPPEIKKNVCIC